MSLKNLYWNNN